MTTVATGERQRATRANERRPTTHCPPQPALPEFWSQKVAGEANGSDVDGGRRPVGLERQRRGVARLTSPGPTKGRSWISHALSPPLSPASEGAALVGTRQ